MYEKNRQRAGYKNILGYQFCFILWDEVFGENAEKPYFRK